MIMICVYAFNKIKSKSTHNREEWEVTIRSTIYSFLLIFLAMIDRTLLLSNYLGNSFLQTEQPPKSEFPSHSSLVSISQ